MKDDKVIQDLLRDFMICIIILGVAMIAMGIATFYLMGGRELWRRLFFSGCFIVPAAFNSRLVIRGYRGK